MVGAEQQWCQHRLCLVVNIEWDSPQCVIHVASLWFDICQYQNGLNKNAKEKLSLGFWVSKIKTDTAGALFPNSWCKQPPPPSSVIGLNIDLVFLSNAGMGVSKWIIYVKFLKSEQMLNFYEAC